MYINIVMPAGDTLCSQMKSFKFDSSSLSHNNFARRIHMANSSARYVQICVCKFDGELAFQHQYHRSIWLI